MMNSRHLVDSNKNCIPLFLFILNEKKRQFRKSCTSLLYTEIDLWNTGSLLIFNLAKNMLEFANNMHTF